MIFKLNFLLIFSLIGINAYSNERGNGGGFVKCPTGYEMADIHEGKIRYELNFNGREKLTEKETVRAGLKKIKKLDEKFFKMVKKNISKYYKNRKITSDTKIFEIKDHDFIVIKKGCSYRQLAVWDNLSGRVFVDGVILNKLNGFHKGALALHEGIYATLRKITNVTNSSEARRLTAYGLAPKAKIPINIKDE